MPDAPRRPGKPCAGCAVLGRPPKDPSAIRPTARGYRFQDFGAREGIHPETAWRWAKKGVIKISRLGPRLGVRVDATRGPAARRRNSRD
jgi:hypothetical protein